MFRDVCLSLLVPNHTWSRTLKVVLKVILGLNFALSGDKQMNTVHLN